MTTYAYPSLSVHPSRTNFGLQSNTQVFESPLSSSIQTMELPGARWKADLRYEALVGEDAAVLQAWLVKLRGRANRFTMPNFARGVPRGSAPGTPRVKGAGQTGVSLLTDGWTASQSGILLPGDLFAVNGELKMVVATANSDGAGESTLSFEPPLRASPADDSSLTTSSPLATFVLLESEVNWESIPGGFVSVSFSAIEAFS